jgi:NTP pyrophosphatase (non-canonical NTP hydrolase)
MKTLKTKIKKGRAVFRHYKADGSCELTITPGDSLIEMQKKIHQNAVDHGWWDGVRTIPELLVLLHSEVSEALEAYRNNDREHYREELADIAIRLLDTAEGQGIDLTAEIIRKHERNISREYKHGGKLL